MLSAERIIVADAGSEMSIAEPGLSMDFQDHTSDSELSDYHETLKTNNNNNNNNSHHHRQSPSPVSPSASRSPSPSSDKNDKDHDEEGSYVGPDESSQDDASKDDDFAAGGSESEHASAADSSGSNRATNSPQPIRGGRAGQEQAYMKANPELYGLRRSVCHHPRYG